jgi:hypothetical protein
MVRSKLLICWSTVQRKILNGPILYHVWARNIWDLENWRYISSAVGSKQIFPEKELRGHSDSSNFHIHVSVSDLYSTIDLPIFLQENMWTDPGNI